MAWKMADREQYQKSISPSLKSLLWQNQDVFMSFAFWARIYFAFPLRTVDYLTPMIQPDEKQLGSTLAPAAAAIFVRMLLPTLWLQSLLTLAVNLSPHPSTDVSMFLLWSSALVVYTMIPRIPELFVCPESIKPVLAQIESPAIARFPPPVAPAKVQQAKNSKQKPQGSDNKKTSKIENENQQPVTES